VSADVSISALQAQLTVDVAGSLSRGAYRYTRIWAREDGQAWRVVGGHVSVVNSSDADASSKPHATGRVFKVWIFLVDLIKM
jgi:hypothetical protein